MVQETLQRLALGDEAEVHGEHPDKFSVISSIAVNETKQVPVVFNLSLQIFTQTHLTSKQKDLCMHVPVIHLDMLQVNYVIA